MRQNLLTPSKDSLVLGNDAKSESNGFQVDVSDGIHRLQAAVQQVLCSMHAVCENANQLALALGLNRRSAWKVWRLAYEPNPLDAVEFLLGRQGFEIFLSAARRLGATVAAETAVRDALRALQEAEDRHAGDRVSLQVMAMNSAPKTGAGADLRTRKQAFLAQSAMLGIQSKVVYSLSILDWTPDVLTLKTVKMTGHLQMRRTRPDATVPITRIGAFDPNSTGPSLNTARDSYRFLGTTTETGPLAVEFCSIPTPGVVERRELNGTRLYQFAPGPIGNAGAINCFVASERVSNYKHQDDDPGMFIGTKCHSPTEMLIVDTYMRTSSFSKGLPQTELYNEIGADRYWCNDPERRLLPELSSTNEGVGLNAARQLLVKSSVRMAEMLFEEGRLNPEEFTLYRVKIEYPPVPAVLGLLFRPA